MVYLFKVKNEGRLLQHTFLERHLLLKFLACSIRFYIKTGENSMIMMMVVYLWIAP